MSLWSKASSNVAQLLTATALTSLSFHLLFARRDAAAERARYTARISILESLIARLRDGERVDDMEIKRLATLARKQEDYETDELGDSERHVHQSTSWKEVFLGAKRIEANDGSEE